MGCDNMAMMYKMFKATLLLLLDLLEHGNVDRAIAKIKEILRE